MRQTLLSCATLVLAALPVPALASGGEGFLAGMQLGAAAVCGIALLVLPNRPRQAVYGALGLCVGIVAYWALLKLFIDLLRPWGQSATVVLIYFVLPVAVPIIGFACGIWLSRRRNASMAPDSTVESDADEADPRRSL